MQNSQRMDTECFEDDFVSTSNHFKYRKKAPHFFLLINENERKKNLLSKFGKKKKRIASFFLFETPLFSSPYSFLRKEKLELGVTPF
jgi:hypothetical protein